MSNLLAANFARLRKDRLFWGLLAVMAMVGVYAVLRRCQIYYELQPDRMEQSHLSWHELFSFAQAIGPATAVFAALFLGTEYSDGTMRGKLTVGCTRAEVYLSSFATVACVSFFLAFACLGSVLLLGLPLLGAPLAENVPYLLEGLVGALGACMAFSAVFTLAAMNCSRKSLSAVICLLGLVASVWLINYLVSALHAPEFDIVGHYDEALGQFVTDQQTPNPQYVGGLRRTVYQFLYDFLPTGQVSQYASMDSMNPMRMTLYAFLFTALSTVTGLALFRCKDLK